MLRMLKYSQSLTQDIYKPNVQQHQHKYSPKVIIIIIQYVWLLSQAFLPGTSLEPAAIPTAQASSFTLQYFPYCV